MLFRSADTPAIRSLDPHLRIPALALCWVVRQMHLRFSEHDTKQRESERWSESKAQAFFTSFAFYQDPSDTGKTTDTEFSSTPSSSSTEHAIPISDRNIQLTAQILMALESVEWLVQVFLLTDYFTPCARYFSGEAFHSQLAKAPGQGGFTSVPNVWQSVEGLLGGCFKVERIIGKKTRKKDKSRGNTGKNSQGTQSNTAQNLYTILDSVSL